jgi:hypothetical protein
VLRQSDIVTLHVPLSPSTRKLIGAKELAMMQSHAVLINTCRGPVVDEAALIAALREGVIAGAGLDVLEEEPTNPSNLLLSMERVVVTGDASSGPRPGGPPGPLAYDFCPLLVEFSWDLMKLWKLRTASASRVAERELSPQVVTPHLAAASTEQIHRGVRFATAPPRGRDSGPPESVPGAQKYLVICWCMYILMEIMFRARVACLALGGRCNRERRRWRTPRASGTAGRSSRWSQGSAALSLRATTALTHVTPDFSHFTDAFGASVIFLSDSSTGPLGGRSV